MLNIQNGPSPTASSRATSNRLNAKMRTNQDLKIKATKVANQRKVAVNRREVEANRREVIANQREVAANQREVVANQKAAAVKAVFRRKKQQPQSQIIMAQLPNRKRLKGYCMFVFVVTFFIWYITMPKQFQTIFHIQIHRRRH